MSPKLVPKIFKLGHYAEHPRNIGALRARDDEILARAIETDLVIVTHNARDFRKLVGRVEVHPGLIIVDEAELDVTLVLINKVISYIESAAGQQSPDHYMVNRVIEIDLSGSIKDYLLPPIERAAPQ
jgi:predicted nuclease of predicted toxin-antitoxin system